MKNEELRPIVDIIRFQLTRAEKLHPVFPVVPADMLAVIVEEIGEAATEVQNLKKAKTAEQYQDAENRLFEELSHVAVTAIRAMVQLNAKPKTKTKG